MTQEPDGGARTTEMENIFIMYSSLVEVVGYTVVVVE
jgi:hypothetical protein